MKKVSATITIDVTAWVENNYDTDELIQYLKEYYGGSPPDGWLHEVGLEAKQAVSNVVVENEE